MKKNPDDLILELIMTIKMFKKKKYGNALNKIYVVFYNY